MVWFGFRVWGVPVRGVSPPQAKKLDTVRGLDRNGRFVREVPRAQCRFVSVSGGCLSGVPRRSKILCTRSPLHSAGGARRWAHPLDLRFSLPRPDSDPRINTDVSDDDIFRKRPEEVSTSQKDFTQSKSFTVEKLFVDYTHYGCPINCIP